MGALEPQEKRTPGCHLEAPLSVLEVPGDRRGRRGIVLSSQDPKGQRQEE